MFTVGSLTSLRIFVVKETESSVHPRRWETPPNTVPTPKVLPLLLLQKKPHLLSNRNQCIFGI